MILSLTWNISYIMHWTNCIRLHQCIPNYKTYFSAVQILLYHQSYAVEDQCDIVYKLYTIRPYGDNHLIAWMLNFICNVPTSGLTPMTKIDVEGNLDKKGWQKKCMNGEHCSLNNKTSLIDLFPTYVITTTKTIPTTTCKEE